MTLDEATAHIGNPVLASGTRGVVHGVIERIDTQKHLVGVREYRKTLPYDLLQGVHWWHPGRLSVRQAS